MSFTSEEFVQYIRYTFTSPYDRTLKRPVSTEFQPEV